MTAKNVEGAALFKKPYPGEASASGSESDEEDDEDLDDASESSSQARPKQMKGDKVHPLRRWAMSKVDAITKGFFTSRGEP